MRDPFEQLRRMQEAIKKIESYVSKGRQRFNREEEIRLSIIRYLQIMKEAAQATSQNFKDNHPEIPWGYLLTFEKFLKFYYLEMKADELWNIAAHDIPQLKPLIDVALDAEERAIEQTASVTSIPIQKETTSTLEKLLQAKREEILDTATKHGASNIRIFGSVARGEADTKSDIDLLVDMEQGRTFFDLSDLLIELQDLLGRDVDVVTEKGLHERIRERVLKEAIPL